MKAAAEAADPTRSSKRAHSDHRPGSSYESSSSDNSQSDNTLSQRNAIVRRSLRQLHTPDRSPLASAVYAVRNEPDEQGHKVLHQVPLNLYTAML